MCVWGGVGWMGPLHVFGLRLQAGSWLVACNWWGALGCMRAGEALLLPFFSPGHMWSLHGFPFCDFTSSDGLLLPSGPGALRTSFPLLTRQESCPFLGPPEPDRGTAAPSPSLPSGRASEGRGRASAVLPPVPTPVVFMNL